MQMTAGKVKVVLVVSGFDVKRSAEVYVVNIYVNTMVGGDDPGKLYKVATIDTLTEKEK